MLLQLVPEPECQPAACALLNALLRRVLWFATAGPEAQGARETSTRLLGAMLQDVVGAVVAAIEAKAAWRRGRACGWRAQGVGAAAGATAVLAAANLSQLDPLVSMLGSFLCALPQGPFRAYLRALDPLPAFPALSNAAALLRAARARVTLAEEIVMFASRAGSMAPAARRRALAALKAGLARHEDQLLAVRPAANAALVQQQRVEDAGGGGIGGGDGASADGEEQRLLPQVADAAWRLARLGAQLADPGLSGVSARLLAIEGPLPPHVICFSRATDGSSAGGGCGGSDAVIYAAAMVIEDEGAVATASGGRRGSKGEAPPSPTGDPRRDAMLFDILKLLGSYLAGPDPAVISTVQCAVRALLADLRSGAALTPLQLMLERARAAAGADDTAAADRTLSACYLAALRPYNGQGDSCPAPSLQGPLPDVVDSSLWSPLSAAHGPWLCRLASTLLAACDRDPVLQLLAPAAALLPAAAEALLPHALREMVGAGEGEYVEDEAEGMEPREAWERLGAAMEAALSAGAAVVAAAAEDGGGSGGDADGGGGAGAPSGSQAALRSGSNLGRQSGSFGRSASGAVAAAAAAPYSGVGAGGGSSSGSSAKAAGSSVSDVKQGLRVLLRALEFLRGLHRDAMLAGARMAEIKRWRTAG